MKGNWKGIYEYNIPEGFEDANLTPVEFNLEITSLENGRFNGTVEDNKEQGGTPGIGQINGSVVGSKIRFEKKMPISSIKYDNGKSKVNENKKHSTLVYEGILTDETIKGTWKFKRKKFLWIGLFPKFYDLGSGTFSMNKIC